MSKPRIVEYEKALQTRKDLSRWLGMEYERRDKLLDELLNSRETINLYKKSLEEANGTIRKYEIYGEIEDSKK